MYVYISVVLCSYSSHSSHNNALTGIRPMPIVPWTMVFVRLREKMNKILKIYDDGDDGDNTFVFTDCRFVCFRPIVRAFSDAYSYIFEASRKLFRRIMTTLSFSTSRTIWLARNVKTKETHK